MLPEQLLHTSVASWCVCKEVYADSMPVPAKIHVHCYDTHISNSRQICQHTEDGARAYICYATNLVSFFGLYHECVKLNIHVIGKLVYLRLMSRSPSAMPRLSRPRGVQMDDATLGSTREDRLWSWFLRYSPSLAHILRSAESSPQRF